MKIRPFVSADQPILIELLRVNTPQYFHPNEEKDFLQYLTTEATAYFVVEMDNKVIGCGGINYGFDQGRTARISWDIIHPNYTGKGLGTTLLKHRINLIREDKKVNTIIVRTSQLVSAFYEKAGFKLTKVIVNYWAQGIDLHQMELKLKSES